MEEGTTVLVVNADDFGLSSGINAGILSAHRNGIVRSTSLMPNGSAFSDAVGISRENPDLGVGVHLSLVGEQCVAPAQDIEGLASRDGRLPAGFADFLRMYVSGKFSIEQIRREVSAQVSKVLDAGVRPTHIDSHQHLHVFPGVIDVVIDAARSASIPVIRLPMETGSIGGRNAQRMILNICCRLALPRIHRAGLIHADHFWGFGVSGSMTEANLTRIIARLKPGVNEIMCHPGRPEPSTIERYQWGYRWEAEQNALCSNAVADLLGKHSVKLSKFGPAA